MKNVPKFRDIFHLSTYNNSIFTAQYILTKRYFFHLGKQVKTLVII
jgi:hypothetical protein